MADEAEMPVDLQVDFAPLQAALRDLQGLAGGFGRAMSTAFRRSVMDGKRLQDVLKSVALSLSGRALAAALAPLERGIGGMLGGLLGGLFSRTGFAKGGLIEAGKVRPFATGGIVPGGMVQPFARGGVVAAPSYFPMRGGLGLMGEAGPEAILPLARGADGRLGVRTSGGSAVNVTFNITARDAESFRRSEAEITAMLARAVGRGRRGL